MHTSRTRSLVTILLALPLALAGQQKTGFANLQEALRAGGSLAGGSGPRNVNWIDGGRRYSFIARSDSGGEEIRVYDPASATDTLLFRAKGLVFPGTTEPFAYQSFQWAPDSKHPVFQTRFKPLYRRSGTSDYFVYTLADRSLKLGASGARTAELSPDGAMMGYERDGNMFVYDFSAGKESQLTNDATPTVYNGHFDWVYEEEFGMAQAWNWSPDSRHLAFWQLDESPEPVIQFSDFSGRHPEWTDIRIPQPGDSNPRVKIGVVDVRSGRRVWLDPGETGEYYIPRIYWTSRADTLAVLTLNRPQNLLKLYFFDVTTGGRRLVFTQQSDTWLDVYDFYARVNEGLASHADSPPELLTFTTSDSARIDISVVKPWPFDSTHRYPMVFAIYGGPGSQQVYNSFSGSAWTQWLAQQGYLVVGVNNRGTNNYGSAFMKTTYKRLGYWEAHDFAETARYLATKTWADGARVAIVGTSYGGYSTVYTMEMYPDLFTVGVANSPVTDWRLYDTIYTERYMGLLSDNAAGYDSSSAVSHARQIKGHLLLIHSMMDDNVHPQNTMQLLTALADARIDVDLRIYPPGHHGAAYNAQSFFLIQQATNDFLARHLKTSAGGATSSGR